jgi:hypothetical protein
MRRIPDGASRIRRHGSRGAPGPLESRHCRRHRLGRREHKGDGAHDLRRTAQCISPGATRAGVSAFQGAAFVLAEPAKHAGLLTGPHSALPAGLNDLTLTADGLGVICPVQRGARVPDKEERSGSSSRQAAELRHVARMALAELGPWGLGILRVLQVGDRWLSRCSSADQSDRHVAAVGRVEYPGLITS